MQKRLAIRYAVDGDLRFISHHDTLRLFERALARSGIPVRFSVGFNPRARISIVLPRPVGVASEDDLLLVGLQEDMSPVEAQDRFAAQMPKGLTVLSVESLDLGEQPRPSEACYELPLEVEDASNIMTRVATFLSSTHCPVQRIKPGSTGGKSVDVRAFIVEMDVRDSVLRWRQSVGQDGSVRIGELLESLGLPAALNLHRVRRKRVSYLDGRP